MSTVGARLAGRYRITRLLGAGGQGSVYAAHDELLGRTVAVKVLSSGAGAEQLGRFHREAKVLAMIKHPNVVSVFDVNWHDGDAYAVMEHLAGPDLARVQSDAGILGVDQVLRYGVALADALTCLHEHRTPVIHRDLKPQNLVLDGDGTVKICDFGLAVAPDALLTRYTEPGVRMGTPEYMSPEQCLGEEVDSATDVYSFGAVLYALLAGGPPFEHAGPFHEYAERVIREEPPAATVYRPDLPPRLVGLIEGMLAKDRAARPTARRVRDTLAALVPAAPRPVAPTLSNPDDGYARDLEAGEVLLRDGCYDRADRHFAQLAHRLRAQPDADESQRFAAEFGRVRSKFGLGEEAVAAIRLVRLINHAEAAFGHDHDLVRDIRAYLDAHTRRA